MRSVRLDVRRTETLKAGGEPIGSHTRVRVVKNKVAPPFKRGGIRHYVRSGISHEGELLDIAVKLGFIQKSGAWFSYKENRLAQGRDNAKEAVKNDPALMKELETLVRANLDKLNPFRQSGAAFHTGGDSAGSRRQGQRSCRQGEDRYFC